MDRPHVPPAIREERAVQAVADRQDGLITTVQLCAIGVSRSAVSRRVTLGRLHRVHRGVYVVGRRELSRQGRFRAAVLSVGEGAVLSHLAAAVLWRFWELEPTTIDVTVARHIRKRKRIKIHSVAVLPSQSTTVRDGIPLTTPTRTLLDLAGTIDSDRVFRRLVHEAEVQRCVDVDGLREEIGRYSRYRGASRLAAEVAEGPKPTRSTLEDDVLVLLRRHKFPPFETNARVPGTPRWVEVDVLFVPQMLAIEIDGERFHATRYRRDLDARKQALVEAAGHRVLRLTAPDVGPKLEAQTVRRVWNALAPTTTSS